MIGAIVVLAVAVLWRVFRAPCSSSHHPATTTAPVIRQQATTPTAPATTTALAIRQRLGTFRRNLKTGFSVDPDALRRLRTILPKGHIAHEAEIDRVGAGKAN
ncbi:hypothetical protein ACFX14_004639 [Malus domestica]